MNNLNGQNIDEDPGWAGVDQDIRPKIPAAEVKKLLAQKRKEDQERAERRRLLDPDIFPQVGGTPSRPERKNRKTIPAPEKISAPEKIPAPETTDIFGRTIESTDGSINQRTLRFPRKIERTDSH